jgi:deoxyribonuclease IV
MAKARKHPVGAHIDGDRPLDLARELGADCVQFFITKPQGWEKPKPRDDAKELRRSKIGVYVHASYLINVCSPRSNVRYGSRKILQQTCDGCAEIGAKALIVHGGHAEDGIDNGVGRWRRTLEMLETDVLVLIENTAGGDNAVARRFDALARLWEAIDLESIDVPVGFCFDTCHAHAAGEDLGTAIERVRGITGRIDLLHANDSRDPPGTGADRHANIGDGKIPLGDLEAMIREANAPTIVETPRDPDALRADIDFVRKALRPAASTRTRPPGSSRRRS